MIKTPIIVDTNILFSSLLRSDSHFVQTLFNKEFSFFICELVFVELFKHKETIIQFSQLSEEETIQLLYLLTKRLNLSKEELIGANHWKKAFELCQEIDEKDTPHVALTLELDGLIWTGDKTLKKGLKKKGFDRFFDPAQETPG